MKDNVKVIHFHIKGRGVQGIVFVQITFEKYTTNFYFQNSQVGIKTKIASLQPFPNIKRFCIFAHFNTASF